MSEHSERWLPVPGYEGLYQVSDQGRIWSHPRERTPGGILRQHPAGRGYLTVYLSRNGKERRLYVHQLVLAAFVGPRPPGMESCHGPAGFLDNALGNLAYGTKAENQRDKIRDGTSQHGERNAQARLTWATVAQIRQRAAAGERRMVLAGEYGVTYRTIGKIVTGTRWNHESLSRNHDGE